MSSQSLLGSDGIVSKKLPSFEIREGQLSMLQDVERAYLEDQITLIEAGTGTGKSLAYLIPAFNWALEKKELTIIATHTIALQEQLLVKDIPFLLEALGVDLKVVLAKGMHNYVCLRKFYDARHEVPDILMDWVSGTQDGSRSALPQFVPHDMWEQINAEAESCSNVKCPYYKECFFFKARKEMLDAQVIVTNHSLLCADLAVRLESDNMDQHCVLPPYRRLVIDEAHHLEDVATDYFADRVSRQRFLHLLNRLAADRGGGKLHFLHQKIREAYPEKELSRDISDLIYVLELELAVEKKHVYDALQGAFEALASFLVDCRKEEKLRFKEEHLIHPSWMHLVQPKINELINRGKGFINTVILLEQKIEHLKDPSLNNKCEGVLADIRGICNRFESALTILKEFAFSPLDPKKVRWVEGEGLNLHLVAADLEVASKLAASLFDRASTVVLCSATLSANKNFAFMRKRLGIADCQERIYDSPFNYAKQTALSVPIDFPDPASPEFIREASELIWEAVKITQGGMFVLFTSYAMLFECKALLQDRFLEHQYALFCQGEMGRSSLLQKFRTSEKAVLFGADSFWEGVDVAGEALRCVVIVKLPFKVPSDPLFQARSEAIANTGLSPFFDYSLPAAIVKFKQGFGRLIRNKEDRGWILCLDSRIVKKGYGKQFLRSLPACAYHFESREDLKSKMKEFYQQRPLRQEEPLALEALCLQPE